MFFWWIIVVLIAIYWLPLLFTRGMFMDGVINAVVAENLANGIGSAFRLEAYTYPDRSYYGHPPLGFWLQAIFFKVTKGAFFTERLYSLFCALGQIYLLIKLWKEVADKHIQQLSWASVLLWLSSPLTLWVYQNNLLENTMSLFTSLSILYFLRSNKHGNTEWSLFFLCCFFMLCAVLVKGVTGLFLLGLPIVFAGWKNGYAVSGIQLAGMLLLLIFLLTGVYLYEPTGVYLENYLQLQLKPALLGSHSKGIHFKIIGDLLTVLSVPALVSFLCRFAGRESRHTTVQNVGWRLLLLALGASLPMVVSHKQSWFYLLPSLPVFVLAFTLLSINGWLVLHQWAEKLSFRFLPHIAAMATGILFFYSISRYNTTGRDEAMLADIDHIASVTNERVIKADNSLIYEWAFQAYLYRYHKIQLCFNASCSSSYVISNHKSPLTTDHILVYKGSFISLFKNITSP